MEYLVLAILCILFGLAGGIGICLTKYQDVLYSNRIRYVYLDNDNILMIDPCGKESTLIYLEIMDYDEAKKIKYVYSSKDDVSYKVKDDGKKFDLIRICASEEYDDG